MPEVLPQARGLSKEQKIGFILLLVFAVLAVGLGVLQIRNTMYGSFALSKAVPATVKDEVSTPDALHYRDTDLDGLNDFDELYVYETSPYLADSDSDGINDRDEITQGKNPLCAEGKECAGVAISPSVDVASSTAGNNLNLAITDPGDAPADLMQTLQDPAQVRQLLKSVGVEDSVLKSITDKELLTMVNDLMNATSTVASTTFNKAD